MQFIVLPLRAGGAGVTSSLYARGGGAPAKNFGTRCIEHRAMQLRAPAFGQRHDSFHRISGEEPMPKIDVSRLPPIVGSKYPQPFDEPCRTRERRRLGEGAGLTQFGVNLMRLPPGAWSSQRHWHAVEDEFVYVLSGEVWLVTEAGEELFRAGDCAGFKAGVRDGHHLQNRSASDAVLLEIGTRDDRDWGEYSDIDMVFRPSRYSGNAVFARKDGTPY